MAVDDAGHRKLAGSVDNLGAGGDHDLLPRFDNLAVAYQDGSGKCALGHGENGGILNHDRRRSQHRGRKCTGNEKGFHRFSPRGTSLVGGAASVAPGRPVAGGSSTGSNFTPSTKTYLTSVWSWNRSP